MDDFINISILMSKSWRTAEGIARVEKIVSGLGVQVTGSGKASISAKVSPALFTQLFGVSPDRVEPVSPGPVDFGSPGGYTCDRELAIPGQLARYVEMIAVVPPARRLI